MEEVRAVPSDEKKRTALEIVLASETFARAEKSRAFLRLVCELEIAGRAAEISEYLIGVKALGRPEDYSPFEDSSVRNRAHELRQRLEKYYRTENPGAALRIELPRGSYIPRFVAAPLRNGRPAAGEEPAGTPHRWSRQPWAAILLAAVLAAAAVAVVVKLGQALPGVDPLVERAWSPLVSKGPQVLIVIATPLHLQVSPYVGPVPEGSPKYAAPSELYALFTRYRPLPKGAQLEMQPVQKAVSMGHVETLARVLGTLDALGTRYQILPETSSPLSAMQGRSVVLIGSPWFSRAASTLLERTPWTTDVDPATQQIGLFGRGPAAGKKYLPQRSPRGEYHEIFGLLSVLPNDEPAQSGRSIIIFSGLTSAGSQGAAAFFTSPSSLADLQRRFRKEGLANWPRSFQVVVRCRLAEDAQLLSYAYEAHSVIEK